MKKQIVFIPIDINTKPDVFVINTKQGLLCNAQTQEGYFFTADELKEIIGKAWEMGWIPEIGYVEDEYLKMKNEYIESLGIK